jgi:4-amino-4-deoxy-L-arabinose transferase-like glycosyltransferase
MWRLLLAAALLYTARIGDLAMPSLEDAFYAREAVEMHRAGRAFTVTWAGEPTHQHPPLQLWLVGRAFAIFGESDFPARLPTVLMALGTLAVTYRIGCQTVGPAAALTGVAMLIATPIFSENARRLAMEIPLTLWVSLAVLLYLDGLARPRRHLLLGLPLGGALLTKSVLGLMPLLAIGGACLSPALRPSLRRPWLWLGIAVGLLLGATWPVHQYLTQGVEAVRLHYLGHVVRRSTATSALGAAITDYPWILLRFYQPLVLPALAGLWRLARRPAGSGPGGPVLIAWVVVPLVLYSVTSFRTPRFIFPILPPLALAGGWWLVEVLPRFAAALTRWIVPATAIAIAATFWVAPSLLTRDANAAFKRSAALLRATVPPDETVPYLGRHYWLVASPLLYYGERRLDRSSASAAEAITAARQRKARVLLCARSHLGDLLGQGVPVETLLEGPAWVLLRIPPLPAGADLAPGAPTASG